ncbi:DUF6119 family protein [Luteithermobacter gelatinilyticus]|uniref:DUF6119 family protein n=1 Tax=Luteithermobacter gelatinilyticus TaxID=2582913 RepID=UPI001106A718|nr:TIGR04141 family sporadically distributed protein [Luteithermobacter gelatinilyticus]
MTSRTISVYLLKEEVADYQDALKDNIAFTRIDPKEGDDETGAALFIKPTLKNPPRWQALLSGTFDLNQVDLGVKSSSAVLFLTVEDRKFALAFGHGHAMLDDAKVVHDFGLEASLSMVEPEQLRNIDVMRPEAMALRKRHQVGRSSRMEEFEIDQLLDVVRSITGRSSDQDFAKKVTGTTAFKITANLEYADLANKCARALELYESDAYQENFALIDNLRSEKDPAVIARLDDALLDALKNREFDRISLSPPEIIEHREIVGFKYRGYAGDEIKPDLDIADYFAVYPDQDALDLTTLKRHKVHVQFEDDESARAIWKLYKCIIFDCVIDDRQYILTEGNWYRIDTAFRDRTNEFFRNSVVEMDLPSAGATEFERDYCARVAQGEGVYLFDRQTFRVPGETARYELCDLLFNERVLLHIKPYKNGSGALSHLFRQGEMAGELFCREPEFRRAARAHLETLNADAVGLIPDEPPDARQYTLRFGIIAKRRAQGGGFDIPFFSKVSFQHAARRLSAYGYRVDVCFIEREAGA